jgi:hypothetical protein
MADEKFLYWAARCENGHAIPVTHFQPIDPHPSWPEKIPLTCQECHISDIYLPKDLQVIEFAAAIPPDRLPKIV